MMYKAPGRSHRKDINMIEIFRRFLNDATAEVWFVGRRWLDGVKCLHCGLDNGLSNGVRL